jgi:hypothetical protein
VKTIDQLLDELLRREGGYRRIIPPIAAGRRI